jgi:glycosyltransferase involved in cell wall biosynthesis
VTKLPLTLAVITFNEEKNIERCIRSVPFAGDVVVVDSNSTDKTIDIARRLGARISVEPWKGFSRQKTRAMALGRFDWVLSLDADEALSEEAQAEILALFSGGEPTVDAYEFSRRTWHLGRWLYHGGNYPDRQIRLFHRLRSKWSEADVHERVIAANKDSHKVERLKSDILHWPFANVAEQVATINRYSALRADEWARQGKTFGRTKMFIKTTGKFFEVYFLKKGFRDGVPGLINAFVASFATFLRWAKLYEKSLKS